MNDHVRGIVERIRRLSSAPDLTPWRRVETHAVGGLTEVAFGTDTDLLLVVSHNGRGVFDCVSGQRVARDYESPDVGGWYDPVRLRADGVGPLAGQSLPLAGMCGGGLPTLTTDGWTIEATYPDWPDCVVVLQPPSKSVFVDRLADGCMKVFDGDPVRCFGFSPTGRTLVVASSHSLHIFGR